MLRWLLLPLGLLVAGAAGWLLLAGAGPLGDASRARAPAVASPPAPAKPLRAAQDAPRAAKDAPDESGDAPMGDIDAASRRELERVLEDEGLGR